MKIIYYSPHPALHFSSATGYGTHMREVMDALRSKGHEVLAVMGGKEIESGSSASVQGSSFKRFIKHFIPKFIWQTLKDRELLKHDRACEKLLEEKIRSFSPELIYERVSYLQLSGYVLAKKYMIKHFAEINAPLVEERNAMEGGSLMKSKAFSIEKQQLEEADRVIVVSSSLRDHFETKYGIEKRKIIITPNGISPDKITIDDLKVEAIRTKLNLKGKYVVGFVGSIFPYHGVEQLIEAFSLFVKKCPTATLLIVGDGQILPELKEECARLGISSQVIFTGSIPHNEVFNYISLFDIAMMTNSNWYGSPVKIFEYGSLGKPIIAPNTGPVRDVIANDVDAVLVEPNVENIYEKLILVHGDPDRYSKMAKQFKEKVLTNYTWERVAEKILDTYKGSL